MASRLSVCLSVALSLTLSYSGHVVWVSLKTVTHTVRLGSSLLAEPNSISIVQRGHPQI